MAAIILVTPRQALPPQKARPNTAGFFFPPDVGRALVWWPNACEVEAMPHYRLYFLRADNRVDRAVDLDCESDEEAIDKASELRGLEAMELWQGTRLVKRIEPG